MAVATDRAERRRALSDYTEACELAEQALMRHHANTRRLQEAQETQVQLKRDLGDLKAMIEASVEAMGVDPLGMLSDGRMAEFKAVAPRPDDPERTLTAIVAGLNGQPMDADELSATDVPDHLLYGGEPEPEREAEDARIEEMTRAQERHEGQPVISATPPEPADEAVDADGRRRDAAAATLALIAETGPMSGVDVAQAHGVTRSAAGQILTKLHADGQLDRHAVHGLVTLYCLPGDSRGRIEAERMRAKAAKTAKGKISPNWTHQDDYLLEVARHGPISAAQLGDKMGLKAVKVGPYLSTLKTAEMLEHIDTVTVRAANGRKASRYGISANGVARLATFGWEAPYKTRKRDQVAT